MLRSWQFLASWIFITYHLPSAITTLYLKTGLYWLLLMSAIVLASSLDFNPVAMLVKIHRGVIRKAWDDFAISDVSRLASFMLLHGTKGFFRLYP